MFTPDFPNGLLEAVQSSAGFWIEHPVAKSQTEIWMDWQHSCKKWPDGQPDGSVEVANWSVFFRLV